MKKKFRMKNDVGIDIDYTVLGVIKNKKNYVVYTNYLPADNEFGIRLLVGELIWDEPIDIKKLPLKDQKEISELFIKEMLMSGRTIRKNK